MAPTDSATPCRQANSPEVEHRRKVRSFQLNMYPALCRSREKNWYFHQYLARLVGRHVLPGAAVIDLGCGNGDMLAALKPARGVGIDFNPAAIAEARAKHPELTFHEMEIESVASLSLPKFDYVILSGVLPQLYDLHSSLVAIAGLCHRDTRLIIATFSRLWQPVIRLGEACGLKQRIIDESWLPSDEIRNILAQNDFSMMRQTEGILLPLHVPLLSNLVNRWVAPLPLLRQLDLCTITIARILPAADATRASSISVIVPVRNEAGNIPALVNRLPAMADTQEVVFVEGNSTDDTWQAIQDAVKNYAGPFQMRAMQQPGRGKGDAVRAGFGAATGDILLILDGDLSVPPEELPRFVDLIRSGRCEFANGSRLVYPMEDQAMQFLNMIANKCFGWMFTFLLGQRLRDTLCGTKVLTRGNYLKIAANRDYFGDFDPFGDFDLLFGAARLNLKIMDVPVHYKQRTYGSTNISRYRHGLLLIRMCGVAARKITFV